MDQVRFTTNSRHKSQHVECWYIQELGENDETMCIIYIGAYYVTITVMSMQFDMKAFTCTLNLLNMW